MKPKLGEGARSRVGVSAGGGYRFGVRVVGESVEVLRVLESRGKGEESVRVVEVKGRGLESVRVAEERDGGVEVKGERRRESLRVVWESRRRDVDMLERENFNGERVSRSCWELAAG